MISGTREFRGILFLVLMLAAALGLLLAGCSDNPVDTNDQPVCDHIDADGLVIEHEHDHDHEKELETLAYQWQGTVTGELELHEGEIMAGVQITFLDADSTRIVVDPACVDHSLAWEIGDTNIVQAMGHGDEPWALDLEPREHGETTIRFRVMHGDHADFTSQAFAVHVHEGGHEHAEAEGLILRRAGADLVTVWQGAVTGSLEVAAGGESLPIDVIFLDHDQDEFTPHGEEYTMGLGVDNSVVASLTPTGDWQFTLGGVSEGTTSITVSILHDGHADFTSADIDVNVIAAAGNPEALAIMDGGTHLVSWNYNGDQSASAEGLLLLDMGETRTDFLVELLGEWVAEAGHGASHRDPLSLPNGRYHLEWEVANPAVATVQTMVGHTWAIEVQGLTAGSTTITATLKEGDTTILATGAMTLIVAAADAGDETADYFLKKNGVRIVYVVDDQLEDQPSGCGSASLGQLEAGVGAETDLFLLKYLTGSCGQDDVPAGRILSFRVADPDVAVVTNHPIHWGERTEFHLRGVAAGATTVQMYLLNASTKEVELVSPPLPVVVSGP
jgi:hypothetical protein